MEASLNIVTGIFFVLAGALIAGIAVYMTSARSKGENIAKEQAARRLALLEEIALHVGSVQHVFQKYRSLIAESFRHKDNWPKARHDELELVTEELVIAFKDIAMAESKLLLLDEKNLNKLLKIYSSKIAHFRNSYYVKKSGVTNEELNEVKQDIANIRDKFFELLSTKYGRKLG